MLDYACRHVNVKVCVCPRARGLQSGWMSTYVCVCVCVSLCVCVCVCVHAYVFSVSHVFACVSMLMYEWVDIYVYKFAKESILCACCVFCACMDGGGVFISRLMCALAQVGEKNNQLQ